MERLSEWRRVQREEIARFLGFQGDSPRLSAGQKRLEMHLDQYMSLPEKGLDSIQNLDPLSEHFGKFLDESKDI